MYLPLSSYQSLPQDPGVYLFLDDNQKIIYVGKARNLQKRVTSYFVNRKRLGPQTSQMLNHARSIKTIKVTSEIESLLLEANLIQKHKPKYNVRFKDGKAYPLIRITIKDKNPKVLVARRMDDPNSLYFGPYPNVGALRLVLKTVRRIFPFQSVLNHQKKPCLYYYIGLCPCPEIFRDNEYKKTIRRIVVFLKGNTKKVVSDLENERERVSKNQEFEKAMLLQKKIDAVKLVTSPIFLPLEYEENPNLAEDLRSKELAELKKILQRSGLKVGDLKRVECFDISIISGKHAAGSMVVFINGRKETSLYRRFKIRDENGKQNDTKMMSEVLRRRLNHKEWGYPDLIIVDGGKGQVSVSQGVLRENNLDISLIGLAKAEETIVLPNLRLLSLPKTSQALHFLMRTRDEAHRFAIFYHRKLRSKFLLS